LNEQLLTAENSKETILKAPDESILERALRTDRRVLLAPELAKLLGAFLICWFHFADNFLVFAYASLPMFLIVGLGFSKEVKDYAGLHRMVKQRFQRLMKPWFIWSAIFAIFLTANQFLVASSPLGPLGWWRKWMIFTGCSLHLWYLPVAFVSSCACSIIASSVTKFSDVVGRDVSILFFVSISLVAVAAAHRISIVEPPLAQWMYIFPAVVFGIAFSIYLNGPRNLIGLLFVILGIAGILGEGLSGIRSGVSLAIGIAAGVAVHFTPWKTEFKGLNSMAFVVYLVHPLVGSIVKRICDFENRSDIFALTVCVLSFGIAFLFLKFKFLSRILL
jgi:hypothetical protein